MNTKNDTHQHKNGEKMNPQTAEFLSKNQAAYQKSEQAHFPIVDEGKLARQKHTNGSTPRRDS